MIILKPQSASGRHIKACVPWSPSKPGPSAFNIDDSATFSESSDDDDSEPYCVCNQHSPPALPKIFHHQNCELGKMFNTILWTLGSLAVLP